MNFNYQFCDIIGNVYQNGNVCFLLDGYMLISPIGNKLKLFQLKENYSRTLHFESKSNITNVAIGKSGTYAIIVNEGGECLYVNLLNEIVLFSSVIGRKKKIRCLEFSPNEKVIAICTRGHIKFFSVSNFRLGQFKPLAFLNERRFSSQPINCIKWSDDGNLLVSGGEDQMIRVFPQKRFYFSNVSCAVISQGRPITAVYFCKNSYDLACVNRGGIATHYKCSIQPGELLLEKRSPQEKKVLLEPLVRYNRTCKVLIFEQCDSFGSYCTASAYNSQLNIFIIGFSNGVFAICQLPEFTLLQSFRAGKQQISSLDITSDGSWLGIGCGKGFDAQLIVWEWQSETYILKQQSHNQVITAASYSPDGSLICTGSEDGKVKIWNCLNSFCLVTFTEHECGVTDVCFTQNGKTILSASLEGTVRAHDMKRYRNFRTMVAPKQTQLNCLCTDTSGELILASSRDLFEIYLWSLDTGHLLDVFTGHTNIISKISCYQSTLASTSIDKTLRLWNLLDGGRESIQLLHEGMDVKYSPCGHLLAVLCYDSCISFFHTANNVEIGSIETKTDIDAGRESKDLIKKSTSNKKKSFTCIAFSPDSLFLLAGGQSNTFCLYSVTERLLLKIFRVSANISLDGVLLDIDYRKITEYGNIDLFECSDSEEDVDERKKKRKLKLAGTRHTDMSERSVKPSMLIFQINFNPTGRSFAIISTEGVSFYALDVHQKFDPFQLKTSITPDEIKIYFNKQEYQKALCFSLHLNDTKLTQEILEAMSVQNLKIVIKNLNLVHAEKLLKWIASQEGTVLSIKLQFYQIIIYELLFYYGAEFKRNLQKNLPSIISIQQTLNQQTNLLSKLCDQNKHSIHYLLVARRLNNQLKTNELKEEDVEMTTATA